MDAKQFIESGILETYAMGLATAEEAKLVAEMVARYPEVKRELRAIESSMENFDQQNAVEPPGHLKEKILSKVHSSQFTVPGSGNGQNETKVVSIAPQKQSNFFKYAAAVALLLLVGSAAFNFYQSSQLSEKSDRVTWLENTMQERIDQDTIIQLLEAQMEKQTAQLELLKKPSMKSIELKGMAEVAPDAKAMAYANTETGEVYLEIMNLPAAPSGMQYQFWGMVDGKPVTAGVIPVEGDLAGIHPMVTVPHAVAYAISLEPMGGSQQPTGKIYVMGNS